MKLIFLSFVMYLTFSSSACSQSLVDSDTIRFNSNVRRGKLDNGFVYYILDTRDTNGKVAFLFIEKAGAYHENANEEEVAHIIEHLSLRSTEHFRQGIRDYFMSHGLQRGRDIKGSTGIQTSYRITINADDSILFNSALIACRDFASGRLYLQREIDQEYAAIKNEAAITQTPLFISEGKKDYLILDENPLFNRQSRAILNDVHSIGIETIKAFDQKWYRPDLQALIIVGDVNDLAVEKKIKSHFSSLRMHSNEASQVADIYQKYDVKLTGRNKQIVVGYGPTLSKPKISIIKKRKSTIGISGPINRSQLKSKIIDDLYNQLVSDRFNRISEDRHSNLRLNHYVDRRAIHPLANIDALTTSIEVDNLITMEQAVKFAMKELRRIVLWGFGSNEYRVAKEVLKKKFEDQQRESSSLAGDLANHFIDGTIFPENESQLKQDLLNEITLSMVNSFAKQWICEDENTDIVFAVSNERDPNIPTEAQTFSWMQRASQVRVNPYNVSNDTDSRISLPHVPQHTGCDYSRSEIEKIKATKIDLQNGIQVVLKQINSSAKSVTTPNVESIVVRGFRLGGLHTLCEGDYTSGLIAANLVLNSGVASLTGQELEEFVRQRNNPEKLAVFPYINAVEEGISARASRSNIDDMFRLVYLYFTKPRKDKSTFKSIIKSWSLNYVPAKSVRQLVADSIAAATLGVPTHPKMQPPKFNRSMTIYRDKFSDASGFRFVITGSFEMDTMIEKVVRYLGALPTQATTPTVKKKCIVADSHASFIVDKDLRARFIGDSTGDVDVKMVFVGNLIATAYNKVVGRLTESTVRNVLFYRLRQQEQAVYDVNTTLRFNEQLGTYTLEVEFSASPSNIPRLTTAVVEELTMLAKGRLDDSIFKNAVSQLQDQLEAESDNASYLNEYLTNQLRNGITLSDGFHRLELLRGVSKNDVTRVLGQSLDTKRFMLFEVL